MDPCSPAAACGGLCFAASGRSCASGPANRPLDAAAVPKLLRAAFAQVACTRRRPGRGSPAGPTYFVTATRRTSAALRPARAAASAIRIRTPADVLRDPGDQIRHDDLHPSAVSVRHCIAVHGHRLPSAFPAAHAAGSTAFFLHRHHGAGGVGQDNARVGAAAPGGPTRRRRRSASSPTPRPSPDPAG